MLKIWRGLRLKLIGQGKLKKYTIYAIGEILLVMVGILLALQVNNWNEKKKEGRQEIDLLMRLNADLEQNLTEINELYEITTLRSQAKDSILYFLDNLNGNEDQLKMYLHEIQWIGGIFNYANTTYKYLESGGISVISNDILRSKITSIYEEDFRNIEVRRLGEINLINQRLKPVVHSQFIPSNITSKRFQMMNIEVLNYPKNPPELAKSQEFINALTELQEFALLRKIIQERTIEKLKGLISDIEKEVEELKK